MIDKNGRRTARKDVAPDGIPEHQSEALTPAQRAAIARAVPGANRGPAAKKGAKKSARKKVAKKAPATKAAAKRAAAKKSTTPVAETKE